MKTTLNIHSDIMELLARAARLNNVSCSEMIFHLVKKVAASVNAPDQIGKIIKYQKRQTPEEWRKFHIKVREDMYEYWLDLRKLLKMSVSLILANAVKKYLAKPIRIKSGDNYACKNYIIVKEVLDSVTIWKLVWGFPPNPGKLIGNEH
jgi:hypothetical protein